MPNSCHDWMSILISISGRADYYYQLMGPPPKYLIHRKLVKKFMEDVVPRKPMIPPYYFTKIFECWKKHGPGSLKCKEDELLYDFANQETANYKKAVRGLSLKQMVASKLQKPVYPVTFKGRHKKDMLTHVLKYFT